MPKSEATQPASGAEATADNIDFLASRGWDVMFVMGTCQLGPHVLSKGHSITIKRGLAPSDHYQVWVNDVAEHVCYGAPDAQRAKLVCTAIEPSFEIGVATRHMRGITLGVCYKGSHGGPGDNGEATGVWVGQGSAPPPPCEKEKPAGGGGRG
jgi:hypothetical protein